MFLEIFQLRIKIRIWQHGEGNRRHFSISAPFLTTFLKVVRKVEITFCCQKEKDLPLVELESNWIKGSKHRSWKLIKQEYQSMTQLPAELLLNYKNAYRLHKNREMKALPDIKPVKSLSRTSGILKTPSGFFLRGTYQAQPDLLRTKCFSIVCQLLFA